MSRNGTGTMSVVNTFVSGEVITASSHNENATDFATELTNSVAADGQTTMTAPLKHSNGTAALPSMTFGSSNNRGIYKSSAGIGFAVSGTAVCEIGIVSPFVRVGMIMIWPALAAPFGWLSCNGQSLLRATYPDLFAIIGDFYGAADGSHFSLPNMQCLAPIHVDTSARGLVTGSDALGALVGTQTKTIAQANLPAATLTTTIGVGQGSHVHPSLSGGLQSGEQASGGGQTGWLSGGSTAIGAATLPEMTGTTPLGGSGTALSVVQPSFVTNFVIFAGAV